MIANGTRVKAVNGLTGHEITGVVTGQLTLDAYILLGDDGERYDVLASFCEATS